MSRLIHGILAIKNQTLIHHLFNGVIHDNQNNKGNTRGSIQTIHGVWDIANYAEGIAPKNAIVLSLEDRTTSSLMMLVDLKRDSRLKDVWSGHWECPRLGPGGVIVCHITSKEFPQFLEKYLPKEYQL